MAAAGGLRNRVAHPEISWIVDTKVGPIDIISLPIYLQFAKIFAREFSSYLPRLKSIRQSFHGARRAMPEDNTSEHKKAQCTLL